MRARKGGGRVGSHAGAVQRAPWAWRIFFLIFDFFAISKIPQNSKKAVVPGPSQRPHGAPGGSTGPACGEGGGVSSIRRSCRGCPLQSAFAAELWSRQHGPGHGRDLWPGGAAPPVHRTLHLNAGLWAVLQRGRMSRGPPGPCRHECRGRLRRAAAAWDPHPLPYGSPVRWLPWRVPPLMTWTGWVGRGGEGAADGGGGGGEQMEAVGGWQIEAGGV